MKLTEEVAISKIQEAFIKDKPFVLFATGTSCAIDTDFGMPALQKHLANSIPKYNLNETQKKEWEKVLEQLDDSKDFEESMNSIEDDELLKYIVKETGNHVYSIDKKHKHKIISGKEKWTAIEILRRLFDRRTSSNPELCVATPNYDMLAEYSFAFENLNYITGFYGGAIKRMDWYKAKRGLSYIKKCGKSEKAYYNKYIKLLKVHGSLNTYYYQYNIVETDMFDEKQIDYPRMIITPGSSKYEKLHHFRQPLLGEYDKAIDEHNFFLFLGFGFNDNQLFNNEIRKKLASDSTGLIITRDFSKKIMKIITESKKTWLICKNESDESTRIFNAEYDDWLYLPDLEIWKFEKFAEKIFGS